MVLPLLGAFFASAAAPAAIGAAASLVGGALGRNAEKKAIASQNEYNSPVNVRARAEEAGFNPLLFVGPGVGQQTATGGSNYMGSAIADAGMLVADAVSRRRELGRLEQLQSQNQKLAEKVANLTLRPKVGGIYARREETPSIAAALGRGRDASGRSVSTLPAGLSLDGTGGPYWPSFRDGQPPRELSKVDALDPRREVDPIKVTNDPGALRVDNPYLPSWWIPAIDGEPVDVMQLPIILGAGAGQAAFAAGRWLSDKQNAAFKSNADAANRRNNPLTASADLWLSQQRRRSRQRAGPLKGLGF